MTSQPSHSCFQFSIILWSCFVWIFFSYEVYGQIKSIIALTKCDEFYFFLVFILVLAFDLWILIVLNLSYKNLLNPKELHCDHNTERFAHWFLWEKDCYVQSCWHEKVPWNNNNTFKLDFCCDSIESVVCLYMNEVTHFLRNYFTYLLYICTIQFKWWVVSSASQPSECITRKNV